MKVMNNFHPKRIAILMVLVLAILAAGSLFLAARPARLTPIASPAPTAVPNPLPTTSTSSTVPKITWSVPHLTQTMFPGSRMTVTTTFESNQNLSGVVIDVTPSLSGVVSSSPSAFSSIIANQSYQITFTLTAPPEFNKRSFGGAVQVRNAGVPGKVYAPPLNVNLQTNWNTVSPDDLFALNLPLGWQINEVSSSGTHTFTVLLPDGTTAGWIYVYTPQQWAAISESDEAPVLLSQTAAFVYAYGDSEALSPDEMGAATDFAHALTNFQTQ
jgi:hypothetical protein